MDGTAEPIIAIIGHPIAGNPTQFALETGFHAAQVECRVLSVDLPAERVSAAIAGMDAMNFRGIWVTPSCKDAASAIVSNELSSHLDFLHHANTPDADSPWTVRSLKQQVWPELAAELLERRSHVCGKLWWIDDQVDPSTENLSLRKTQIMDQLQAIHHETFSAMTMDKIEIIADVTGLADEEVSEEGDSVLVLARPQKVQSEWQLPSQSILLDLNENWDPAYLARWERVKADTEGACLRGPDVHAACLTELTKLLFDRHVESEVFQEAIDEYLAV